MTTETLAYAVRDGIARTIAVVDLPGKFQDTLVHA
jgi:hypothetical protein